jgi:hypothetical protein
MRWVAAPRRLAAGPQLSPGAFGPRVCAEQGTDPGEQREIRVDPAAVNQFSKLAAAVAAWSRWPARALASAKAGSAWIRISGSAVPSP